MTKNQKAQQKQRKRRETMAKDNINLHKGTIDPKWLIRGNITNYNHSDVISNGGG